MRGNVVISCREHFKVEYANFSDTLFFYGNPHSAVALNMSWD